MQNRPRRNRKNQTIRNFVSENKVEVSNLIQPLFVIEGENIKKPIESMPGQFRFSLDNLLAEVEELLGLGVQTIALFPAIDEDKKDSRGTWSRKKENINLKSIQAIKEKFPEMMVMGDIALDPYSSDGHDGVVNHDTGEILNDETLPILAEMAVCQAQAGVDIVGPSDMMDGRIGTIRRTLDGSGYKNVSIMSYTAKYASAFYGPFRDALDSAPKFGDKKTYQMDPANSREALREAMLDMEEGADMLMVKPAMAYLDIISKLKENTHLPIAAYQVSGEYAMLHAAANNGWLDLEQVRDESLLSIKRAGADIILSYFAKEFAKKA